MVDNAFTLFCFWAALAFGKWIDTGSARAAFLTGLLAALGLLTKINSIYLILLPPLTFLILGCWRLLLRRTFWIIPAVVAVLWGPWIFYTRKMISIGFGGLLRPDVPHLALSISLALRNNPRLDSLFGFLAGGILTRSGRRDSTLRR